MEEINSFFLQPTFHAAEQVSKDLVQPKPDNISAHTNVAHSNTESFHVNLRAVPSISYVSSSYIPASLTHRKHSREKVRRAFPLWAKVLIAATFVTAVIAAIVGPAVYFSLAGQFFVFTYFLLCPVWRKYVVYLVVPVMFLYLVRMILQLYQRYILYPMTPHVLMFGVEQVGSNADNSTSQQLFGSCSEKKLREQTEESFFQKQNAHVCAELHADSNHQPFFRKFPKSCRETLLLTFLATCFAPGMST